ncbi:P-loop containing nucleoside triphosphate hydrolase protein [Chytriomyces sp. MP71]|nr:P-loop containing nucleoside triphosphate hydrolase protein [Chytriomyces sp. MP71]
MQKSALFVPPPVSRILPWFPKHQQNTLRLLRDGIHHVDLVLEVRDARIPLSSANAQFQEVLGRRERIIVFNKQDLANQNMTQTLASTLTKETSDKFIFACSKSKTGGIHSSVKRVMAMLVEKAKANQQRMHDMSIVVVGLPNVGKSSIINALRNVGTNKGKASQVANFAGVTRAIQTKVKIHSDPNIYLVDTPGVLNPQVKSPIQGLRVALVGCTKDNLSDEIAIAEYLLFRLNQSKVAIQSYASLLALDAPATQIHPLLMSVVAAGRAQRVPQSSSMAEAAHVFISLFRKGAFGPLTLDDCSPEGMAELLAEIVGAGVEGGAGVVTPGRDLSMQREGLNGRILYSLENE